MKGGRGSFLLIVMKRGRAIRCADVCDICLCVCNGGVQGGSRKEMDTECREDTNVRNHKPVFCFFQFSVLSFSHYSTW